MKIVVSISLLIVLAFGANENAHASQKIPPITEDGLIRLLQDKIARVPLIHAVQSYGVAFQLTSLFERELVREGNYLGGKGVAALIAAIRANFRPPVVRPFRFMYQPLEGHAIDLLLNNQIGRWEKALDGKYFIVQNEVYKTLSDLVARFSEDFSGDKFLRIGGPRRTSRRLGIEYKEQHKRVFVGSSGSAFNEDEWGKGGTLETGFGQLSSISSSYIDDLVNSLNNSEKKWNFYAFKEKPVDIRIFRKFAEAGDLDAFEPDTRQEFYSYITKDYLPPDFGIVELSIEETEGSADGCEHHARASWLTWSATFFAPLLRMNVAIIENVSNEPITVGRFILTENDSTRLQPRAAVQVDLSSRLPRKDDLFAPGILKPGESLVVPIELMFKFERKDLVEYFDWPRAGANYSANFISRARASNGLNFADPFGKNFPTVSADALERIVKREEVDFSSPAEYVYGPSVNIESLEINRFSYLVRKFNSSKLLITSGIDGETDVGSCPYVYTYSTRQKSWLSEGVILYGYNSKLKESTDEIALKRFNGKVLIREQDPEASFIDSMYVRAISADGTETVIYPTEPKLKAADGNYLQLRQGDQLALEFPVPAGLVAEKYFLTASGYYVPYHSMLSPGLKRRSGVRRFRVTN